VESAVCASGGAAAAMRSSRRFIGGFSPVILFWLLQAA
jgi:hypothetical protein